MTLRLNHHVYSVPLSFYVSVKWCHNSLQVTSGDCCCCIILVWIKNIRMSHRTWPISVLLSALSWWMRLIKKQTSWMNIDLEWILNKHVVYFAHMISFEQIKVHLGASNVILLFWQCKNTYKCIRWLFWKGWTYLFNQPVYYKPTDLT